MLFVVCLLDSPSDTSDTVGTLQTTHQIRLICLPSVTFVIVFGSGVVVAAIDALSPPTLSDNLARRPAASSSNTVV